MVIFSRRTGKRNGKLSTQRPLEWLTKHANSSLAGRLAVQTLNFGECEKIHEHQIGANRDLYWMSGSRANRLSLPKIAALGRLLSSLDSSRIVSASFGASGCFVTYKL